MTGQTIVSLQLSTATVDELVMASQGIGHQIEKLREDRRQLSRLIAKKLNDERRQRIESQMAELQAQLNGSAPGASLVAGTE